MVVVGGQRRGCLGFVYSWNSLKIVLFLEDVSFLVLEVSKDWVLKRRKKFSLGFFGSVLGVYFQVRERDWFSVILGFSRGFFGLIFIFIYFQVFIIVYSGGVSFQWIKKLIWFFLFFGWFGLNLGVLDGRGICLKDDEVEGVNFSN